MTQSADSLKWIVDQIHPELKELGFRKRRNSFNRSAEDGVVQVITFEAGRSLPPGAQPIPHFRPDLHGLFTLSLGVAIREAWDQYMRYTRPFPTFLTEPQCEIRDMYGRTEHIWWRLSQDDATVAELTGAEVLGPGITWLEHRATRKQILDIWESEGREGLPITTDLPIVMILRHLERPGEAATVLREYYDSLEPGAHRTYVFGQADVLGVHGLPQP